MTRPQPTIAERDRWSWFQDVGCLPCRKDGRMGVPADVAHETQGGRRTGHGFTFPGCEYHHRGVLPPGMDGNSATALYGPSLAISRRSFEMRYGTEAELLADVDKRVQAVLKREVAA